MLWSVTFLSPGDQNRLWHYSFISGYFLLRLRKVIERQFTRTEQIWWTQINRFQISIAKVTCSSTVAFDTLKTVAAEQKRRKDRLSVALLMAENLSYYESRLLWDVITVEQGLIMQIASPLSSKQTAFTVFRSIAVPLPQLEPDWTITWKKEAPYLPLSEEKHGNSLPDGIWSLNNYRILEVSKMLGDDCNWNRTSMLFTNTCDGEQIARPATENSANCAFEVWLII